MLNPTEVNGLNSTKINFLDVLISLFLLRGLIFGILQLIVNMDGTSHNRNRKLNMNANDYVALC